MKREDSESSFWLISFNINVRITKMSPYSMKCVNLLKKATVGRSKELKISALNIFHRLISQQNILRPIELVYWWCMIFRASELYNRFRWNLDDDKLYAFNAIHANMGNRSPHLCSVNSPHHQLSSFKLIWFLRAVSMVIRWLQNHQTTVPVPNHVFSPERYITIWNLISLFQSLFLSCVCFFVTRT